MFRYLLSLFVLFFISNKVVAQYSLEVQSGLSIVVFEDVPNLNSPNIDKLSMAPLFGVEFRKYFKRNYISVNNTFTRHSRDFCEIAAIKTIAQERYFFNSLKISYGKAFFNNVSFGLGISNLQLFENQSHFSSNGQLLYSEKASENFFSIDLDIKTQFKRIALSFTYKFVLENQSSLENSQLLNLTVGYCIL